MKKRWISLCLVVMMVMTMMRAASATEPKMPTISVDWQTLLRRPYTEGVPLGYSEEVYSLYQPGWGFDRSVIYRSGCREAFGMETTVYVDGQPLPTGEAWHTPAYVVTEAAERRYVEINHADDDDAEKTVSFAQTKYGNTLNMAFDGDISDVGKNWNTWDAVTRYGDEWLEVRYAEAKGLDAVQLWLYTDANVYPPEAVKVQYWGDDGWNDAEEVSVPPLKQGENLITLTHTVAKAFRLVFTPVAGKALSFYEIKLIERVPLPEAATVTGYKYIAPNGMAVVLLDAVNPTEIETTVQVEVTPLYTSSPVEGGLTGNLSGFTLLTAGDTHCSSNNGRLTAEIVLRPDESRRLTVATAFGDSLTEGRTAIDGLLADSDPLATQTEAFLGWFEDNIPYVDLPDETLRQIYYYRWYTYRSQLRQLADGSYVITEFLPYVGWSGPYNTINMPLGSHVAEGRWLRNPRYLSSALTFWIDREGRQNARAFSTWLPTAFYQYYLVTRDETVLTRLEALKADYAGWEATNYDAAMGLFFSNNGADGMEYSAVRPNDWGVEGYRPTVNAYRYSDAIAIEALCELTGDAEGAALYRDKAAALRERANTLLFDREESFYKWILRGETALTDPRELIGYLPWMFGLAEDNRETAAAWRYLTDPAYFAAPYGPRTVEKTFARVTPEGEYGSGICRWDGPSWPFATSQTLNAMANLLHDYECHGGIGREDYLALLQTYAASHYKDGYPWLAENLDADSGRWIADIDRSPLYNHSEFVNLLVSGLFGVRPTLTDGMIVRPLVPDAWDWFCLRDLPWGGQTLTLVYDRDGSHYGMGSGYRILVDGQEAHHSDQVEEVRLALDGPSDGTDTEAKPDAEANVPAKASRSLWFWIGAAVSILAMGAAVLMGIRSKKRYS